MPVLNSKASQVKERFMVCRTSGHRWGNSDVKKEGYTFIEQVQCRLCDTIRIDYWSRRGYKMKPRRYDYTEGYIIAGSLDIDDKANLRALLLTGRAQTFR